MRRIALIALVIPLLAGGVAAVAGADDVRSYKIEMYNAFGIVEDSEVRVAGVTVGKVTDLTVNDEKRALVSVELEGELSQLGENTECSSEPQSLIAEYFIDCDPDGPPLPEGGTIPASQVTQTVQPDLVQNTLRDPYKERLRLLINEFGTALAGNGETLNEAIRQGAPALTELQEVTKILASQAALIRDLNVDSDRIIGELEAYKEQIVQFVDEAEDAGRASAERREDLSHDFDRLDDLLAELEPTLAELDNAADEQTPLLRDLHAAAPELNRLALNLPPFNDATKRSLTSLAGAARIGERALRRGRDEIALLADAGRNAPEASEILADLVRDLDDPRRAVEINDLAGPTTGRTGTRPGTRNTMGYTGLEALLNYPYYQAQALNQFDRVSHLLHFGLYEVFTGPCGEFSTARNPDTGEIEIPRQDGGFTNETNTEYTEIADCMGWLGPNQAGLTQPIDLPKYHPSVCPDGTAPERAREELCDPTDSASASSPTARSARAGDRSRPGAPDAGPVPGGLPQDPDEIQSELENILDLPNNALNGLGGKGVPGLSPGTNQATEDLLDLLLGP